jgi:hypothetical protein
LDVFVDISFFDTPKQDPGCEKIIYSPTYVIFPGTSTIAPPSIFGGGGIEMPKGIDKTC